MPSNSSLRKQESTACGVACLRPGSDGSDGSDGEQPLPEIPSAGRIAGIAYSANGQAGRWSFTLDCGWTHTSSPKLGVSEFNVDLINKLK